ncbi:MAG: GNAT family N-acetyltransferase [Verrucomicrobiota bacterium]|nr:GNAT family N-acetyltransferase [Verrucomicrobiota bacterium]
MMMEYALGRFPLPVKLRDRTECLLRPIGRRDAARLYRFFVAVPEEERLFIKQLAFDRSTFQRWCRYADFERDLPLILLHREKIIAEACLHQRLGGWKRHIGLITVLTHPQYRGRDAAKLLVGELVETARAMGLRQLEAELNGERKSTLRALEEMGFRQLLRLPDYVLDMKAVFHDYVLLSLDLRVNEEYAGIGE